MARTKILRSCKIDRRLNELKKWSRPFEFQRRETTTAPNSQVCMDLPRALPLQLNSNFEKKLHPLQIGSQLNYSNLLTQACDHKLANP